MPGKKQLQRILKLVFNKKNNVKGNIPLHFFENKIGIEIGGPTELFQNLIPIYKIAAEIDGCNFSCNTIWEGNIVKGNTYDYSGNKKGVQYISEASDLREIETGKYDFLLASHCLEHCANSIKTIEEWLRVVKPGGCLLIILPEKKNTFDHRRNVTTFRHLLDDYKNNVQENDLTHLSEILKLHDLSMDIAAGDEINFRKRSYNNFTNRCLHHHVFDFSLLRQIFNYFKVEIRNEQWLPPYHQIVVVEKSHKSID